MKRILKYFISLIIILGLCYYIAGFYVAYQILKIDYSCGLHEGSKPNKWSTSVDAHQYQNISQRIIRENFQSEKYFLDDWQEVYFSSRENGIKLSGWLFNFFPNKSQLYSYT